MAKKLVKLPGAAEVLLEDRIAASLKRIETLENEMAAVQRERNRRNAEWDQWRSAQKGERS